MYKKYHINYPDRVQFGDTTLFQLGRLHCSPAMLIPEHVHIDLYELTVVTDGEGIVTTNGLSVPVSKGDIYLSFPADLHRIDSSVQRPLKYDFFAFNTTDGELSAALKQIMTDRRSGAQRIVKNERIAADIARAIAEFGAKNDYRDQILSLLLKQIIVYAIRSFYLKETVGRIEVNSADEICFQIMDYIDVNIYSIKNLAVLSEALGYNYSYLSNVFRQSTGGTISDYYQANRLERAKMLLLEKKLKSIQIAELLNYSSLYSFSKAFKRRYGVSPRNFIKQTGVTEA